VNSAAIGALSRRAGPQKRDHGRAGPEISVAAVAVARLDGQQRRFRFTPSNLRSPSLKVRVAAAWNER
jgi:hypothetical protein